MLILDEEVRNIFIKSLGNDLHLDTNILLKEFFKISHNSLKEDVENFDFNSLRGRCSWFLSKLINNKESILNYQSSDLFKSMFKTINITSSKDSDTLSLSINGQQITGDNIYLLLTFIIYAYILTVSLTSIGNDYDKIGGAVLYKFSEIISYELMKRSDLSSFVLGGSSYKDLIDKIPDDYNISIIVSSLIGLILIGGGGDFTDVHKETLLIAINIIKTNVSNSIGYLYTFINKAGQLVKIDTGFIAKDIYYQFKSLGINIVNKNYSNLNKTIKSSKELPKIENKPKIDNKPKSKIKPEEFKKQVSTPAVKTAV